MLSKARIKINYHTFTHSFVRTLIRSKHCPPGTPPYCSQLMYIVSYIRPIYI